MLDGRLDIISGLKEEYFTDKYKRLYILCLEFFEQYKKLPSYEELSAVIEVKAPVQVKSIYQALVTGLKNSDELPDTNVIISGITESHVLRNVDSDIEELVIASRDRDVNKVKNLLNKLNNQVNLSGVEILDIADVKGLEDNHATVRSALPKEHEDEFLGGGHTGLTIVSAASGAGKACQDDTLIPTPHGRVRIADLAVGDTVYGRNGLTTKVTGVYPQGMRPTYEVTFRDGRSILVDEEHIWTVKRKGRKNEIDITTKEMLDNPMDYEVPLCLPIDIPSKVTKCSPYEVGKSIAMGTPPLDVDTYIYNCVATRKELLRGVKESADSNIVEVVTISSVRIIQELVRSLGGLCNVLHNEGVYKLYIELRHNGYNSIMSIDYVGDMSCTCISVDAEDKLYLAGDYIVTHNTVYLLQAAKNNYLDGKNVLFITLELPKSVLYKRLMSSVSGIEFSKIMSGDLTDGEKKALDEAHDLFFNQGNENYFKIIDESIDDLQLVNIIAVEAQLRNLDVVVLDYVQLVEINSSGDDWRGLSHLAKKLHKLTRTYGISIITAAQVNVEGNEKGSIMPKITTRGSKELEFSSSQFIHLQAEPESGGLIMFTKKNRISECKHLILEKDFAHMKIDSTGLALN